MKQNQSKQNFFKDRALYYRTVIQGYKTTDIIDERSKLEMLAHKSNIITNYVGEKKEIDKNVTNILSASKEAKQNFSCQNCLVIWLKT